MLILHFPFIKALLKDRRIPTNIIDKSVLATCHDFTNMPVKAMFLKEWGNKAGIYLIEYKYDPSIFYIGRTNLFKKRFYEHWKAESSSKFHLFIRLVGIKHFKFHVIEVCSKSELADRESYYLKNYLPLLNSVFSSKVELTVRETLASKLKKLRNLNKALPSEPKRLVYTYDTSREGGINQKAIIFKNSREASITLGLPVSGILRYRNTGIPYRNKFFYSRPLVDFMQVWKESLRITPKGLTNKIRSKRVFAYNAKTLQGMSGTPFISINKALGVHRSSIEFNLDKGKPVIARKSGYVIYFYSRDLSIVEKKILLKKYAFLPLRNKVPVYIYDATTKKLVNGLPSLIDAASYLNIGYRKLSRHLNTHKALKVDENLVYLFDKKLGQEVSPVDTDIVIARARNYKTRLWVYFADTLELVNNGPFETILSASQYLDTERSTIHRKLDSNKPVMLNKKSLSVYFFSKKLDSQLKQELIQQQATKYVRSVIWVYKVLDNGEFVLLPNQPFKSKREAGRILGMDPKYITKYLNTNQVYQNFIFLTLPKQL